MLIGHEDAWAAWNAARNGERMHHAWLLIGKAGLGKTQFALAAAQSLVGGGGDPARHPDILRISYGPKTKEDAKKRDDGKPFELARGIKIEQVRETQRRLTTRPTLGDWRVVIIDPADDMETGAANALLKSLEEPPQGCVFLLVSHNPSRLLPTIRSRCRTLRFAGLSDEALGRFLADRVPDAPGAERSAAVLAAAGSPGAALAFLGLGLAPLAKAMRHIRDSGDLGFDARGELASLIGQRPDRERMRAVLDLARTLAGEGAETLPARLAAKRIDAHSALVRLSAEQATYNYDPGLFALEIGNLLAACAAASTPADA
ncbi:AAA family ATPase [Qipengyuania sediminis]|uniref:AAA family ATPase n=1 Tax=Qipengyuania sediminis TaxID=1532023 RepID=UPI0010595B70|nr:AAA family ATPase [Qipengyuania sediminis]